VVDGALASVEAYASSDWSVPIARAALPGDLTHGGVVIRRDDL
jgi:hypothetical protein